MSAGHARLDAGLTRGSRIAGRVGLAALFVLFGCESLQTAIANGDTRTLSMHHMHTDESITITYKRNGRYDEEALKKINWFLRDWRRQEETRMDPRLLDIVWEVATELHAQKPIEIVCGYRASATNEMLRKRSSGVAKASMHTHGQAMDFYIPDVPLEQLRYAGLRLQRGGVGFYPTSGSPFVHLDTGKVRHWPDISRQELARVFPNGRTVHVPSDGRPMSGYALALADVEKRGSSPSQSSLDAAQGAGIAVASNAKNSSASGGKDDEEDDAANTPSRATAAKPATTTYRTAEAVPAEPAPLRLASVPLPRKRPPIPAQTVAQAGSPAKNAGSSGPWDRGQSLAQVDSAAAAAKSGVALTAAKDSGAVLAYAPASAVTAPASGAAAAIAESIVAKTSAPSRAQPTPRPVATQISGAALVAASAKTQNTEDLWTRAMMMAPDLQYYMSATLLGKPDFKQLRHLMQKPAMALAMSFGDDPMLGMSADHFSGDAAVVFLATVPVTTQSAMLQQ
jgi:uncharacterized protein YcbK (DUF882 family)